MNQKKKIMDYPSDLIEKLILSHLYTLIKYHEIRTGAELKFLGFDKILNDNAINDIMEYHDMYSEITQESFKHSDELRDKLLTIVKELSDGFKKVRLNPNDGLRHFSIRQPPE